MTRPRRHAYFWVSPRGFSNEGTVYVVPEQRAMIAGRRLDDRFGADLDARYYRLSRDEAERKATGEYADFAHTLRFCSAPGGEADPLADCVAASGWLWHQGDEDDH